MAFQFSSGMVAFGRRIRQRACGNYVPSQEGYGASRPRLRRVCQGFGSHSCASLLEFAIRPLFTPSQGYRGVKAHSFHPCRIRRRAWSNYEQLSCCAKADWKRKLMDCPCLKKWKALLSGIAYCFEDSFGL